MESSGDRPGLHHKTKCYTLFFLDHFITVYSSAFLSSLRAHYLHGQKTISLYSIVFLQSACLKVCTAVVWLVCEVPTCNYEGLHRLAVSTDEGCIQGVAVRSAPQGGHFTAVVSQGHSRGGAEAEIFGRSNYTSENQSDFRKCMRKNRNFSFIVYKVKYLQTLWINNIYYNANSFNKHLIYVAIYFCNIKHNAPASKLSNSSSRSGQGNKRSTIVTSLQYNGTYAGQGP